MERMDNKMSDNEDFSEFISFRTLTPEEILQAQNRQTILTPREKFERIQKTLDRRARRLRKYHFIAIQTTHELFIFDGEGEEIGKFENSVDGCRDAREKCLEIFLAADNQNGGYTFTGPNFEQFTDEEIVEIRKSNKRHLDYHGFTKQEIELGEYTLEEITVKKNYCHKCETQFKTIEEIALHLCTDRWIVLNFHVHKQNFGMEGRIELR